MIPVLLANFAKVMRLNNQSVGSFDLKFLSVTMQRTREGRKEGGRERGENLHCDCRGQGGSTALKSRSLHNNW